MAFVDNDLDALQIAGATPERCAWIWFLDVGKFHPV